MELQWNFEKTSTGVTTPETTNDIGTELHDAVMRLFRDSLDYQEQDFISKYQMINETLTFLFEDYRNRFKTVLDRRWGLMDEQRHQVEATVFCAWMSIQVMKSLSDYRWNTKQ